MTNHCSNVIVLACHSLLVGIQAWILPIPEAEPNRLPCEFVDEVVSKQTLNNSLSKCQLFGRTPEVEEGMIQHTCVAREPKCVAVLDCVNFLLARVTFLRI